MLAVHFQFMNDKGKIARELFNGKHFIASIVPNLLDPSMKTDEGEEIYNRIHPLSNYYPGWAKNIFRRNKDNSHVTWVQEGYRHCCGRCYNKGKAIGKKSPDPYHEHVCLDRHSQSLEEQIEIIGKGKELIKKELGIVPIGYCPPNHLYNKDTLRAAEENDFSYFLIRNGFDYFANGLIEILSYRDNKLVILPETKNGRSPIKITYYDHISEGRFPQYNEIPADFLDLIFPVDKPRFKAWANEKAITAYKKLRDLKNLR